MWNDALWESFSSTRRPSSLFFPPRDQSLSNFMIQVINVCLPSPNLPHGCRIMACHREHACVINLTHQRIRECSRALGFDSTSSFCRTPGSAPPRGGWDPWPPVPPCSLWKPLQQTPIAAQPRAQARSHLPNSSAHLFLIIFHGGQSIFVHSLNEILNITEKVSESNPGYARLWL